MSFSESLLEAAFREVLFSTLVCGVVLVLAWALRHRSPGLRLALWSLVLVRLVLPPDLASPWSARSLVESGTGWLASREGRAPGGEASSPAWVLGSSTAETVVPVPSSRQPGRTWRDLLVGLWGLGTLTYFVLFVRRRRHFRRVIAEARPIDGGPILEVLSSWRRRLGIRRTVRLVTSGVAKTPFTIGVLHPSIFVPRAVLRHPDKTLVEGVVAHELAHVKRLDDVLVLICRFLQGLYFFHPVVWLAARKINDETEQLCDALVLAQDSPITSRAYGRGILTVLRMSLEPAEPAAAFGSTKRSYKMRIREILSTGVSTRGGFLPAFGLALLIGVFLLPMARVQAEPPDAQAEPPDAQAAEQPDARSQEEIDREAIRERLRARLRTLEEVQGAPGSEPAADKPRLPVPDVDVVVVVNAENPTASVTRGELASIYYKKLTEWGPGQPIEPLDQNSSSDVRKAFSQAIFGKSPKALDVHWQRQIYKQKEQVYHTVDMPPLLLESDSEVIDYVRRYPGAIGYVSADTRLGQGVKSLQVTDL